MRMILYILLTSMTSMIIIQATHSMLMSEDAIERDCLSDPKSPSNVDIAWLFQSRNYFVPIASEHLYIIYFEGLTGQCAEDQAELNKLNLRVTFTGGAVTTTGNGQRFYQMCTPWSFYLSLAGAMDAKCAPTFGTEKTNLTKIGTTRDTLVWSDNKTAFMVVSCIHEKEKAWKILSNKPTLDGPAKEAMLAKVRELGFNETKVSFMPYEKDDETQPEKKEPPSNDPIEILYSNLGFAL